MVRSCSGRDDLLFRCDLTLSASIQEFRTRTLRSWYSSFVNALKRQVFIEAKLLVYREQLAVDEDMPETIQIATERIHERLFRRNLTVKRLRRRLGLTSATFSAQFRRYHGWSPARYIRWLRVDAAKALLRHDEVPVAEIAFNVGYEHYRSFARIFKRVTGRPPRAFREEIDSL